MSEEDEKKKGAIEENPELGGQPELKPEMPTVPEAKPEAPPAPGIGGLAEKPEEPPSCQWFMNDMKFCDKFKKNVKCNGDVNNCPFCK